MGMLYLILKGLLSSHRTDGGVYWSWQTWERGDIKSITNALRGDHPRVEKSDMDGYPSMKAKARVQEYFQEKKEDFAIYRRDKESANYYVNRDAIEHLRRLAYPIRNPYAVDAYFAWLFFFIDESTPFFPPLPLRLDCIKSIIKYPSSSCDHDHKKDQRPYIDELALTNLNNRFPTLIKTLKKQKINNTYYIKPPL